MKKAFSLLTVLALTLALAGTAYAQSSVQGYNDEGGQVQSGVQGGQEQAGPGATTEAGGSLPFTGLDIALVAMAGGALVAAGFGMRRLTRSSESA
jgi:hypothetical protein